MKVDINQPIVMLSILVLIVALSYGWLSHQQSDREVPAPSIADEQYTNDEWRAKLTPEAYKILRAGGTERPFSSLLNNEKRAGTYVTVDTGEAVFRSEDKFDSGTGWPSFTQPIRLGSVLERIDRSLFTERTEILSLAGGHLGHVFRDGPPPTGLRYCINGTALRFIPDVK